MKRRYRSKYAKAHTKDAERLVTLDRMTICQSCIQIKKLKTKLKNAKANYTISKFLKSRLLKNMIFNLIWPISGSAVLVF